MRPCGLLTVSRVTVTLLADPITRTQCQTGTRKMKPDPFMRHDGSLPILPWCQVHSPTGPAVTYTVTLGAYILASTFLRLSSLVVGGSWLSL